jgi:hypothetical protein
LTAKGFEQISPQRKYNGISFQLTGQIKNTRTPFNVDMGVAEKFDALLKTWDSIDGIWN